MYMRKCALETSIMRKGIAGVHPFGACENAVAEGSQVKVFFHVFKRLRLRAPTANPTTRIIIQSPPLRQRALIKEFSYNISQY